MGISSCLVASADDSCPGLIALSGTGTGAQALRPIAEEIVADSRWCDRDDIVFVIKEGFFKSTLTVFGEFTASDLSRLENLADQLQRYAVAGRYVDYKQAEGDAEILASKLISEFGRTELRKFSFHGIPRGGWIVLGLMSYALDLPVSALHRSPNLETPAVVFDDCAITGLRFRQFLDRISSEQVIFAPLYSHPELRATVIERESRVMAAIGAVNLGDFPNELNQDQLEEWRSRWLQRWDNQAYWIGRVEHVCFAWTQPQSSFLNSATGEIESGWRLAPKARCLKHRTEGSSAKSSTSGVSNGNLQFLSIPPSSGRFQLADRVIYASMADGSIAATVIPHRDCYLLKGTAADMWNALVRFKEIGPAVESLVEEYDVPREALLDDFNSFVSDLVANGLLK